MDSKAPGRFRGSGPTLAVWGDAGGAGGAGDAVGAGVARGAGGAGGAGVARGAGGAGEAFLGRYVKLMRLSAMWPPPRTAPALQRHLYAAYSAVYWLFSLVNTLGEIGGFLFLSKNLETKSQSLNAAMFRFLALTELTLFLRSVRTIQALVEEMERITNVDHGLYARERVQRLNQAAARFSNKLLKYYAAWFIFSSVGVVTQPVVIWAVIGHRPRPFLSSNFWLLGSVDTPVKEVVVYTSQTLAQFTSTATTVAHECFFAAMGVNAAYQSKVLGAVIDDMRISMKKSGRSEKQIRQDFIHCIKFHQDILNFSDRLQRQLRFMVLIQFTISLTFIATMLYQLAVLPPSNIKFIATAMILICANIQVGVYCYSSDQMQESTLEVCSHLMGSDWPDAPRSVRRMLPFMLLRTSRPASLWCWRAARVALPTWLQTLVRLSQTGATAMTDANDFYFLIVNKAYSFYAVMRSSDG